MRFTRINLNREHEFYCPNCGKSSDVYEDVNNRGSYFCHNCHHYWRCSIWCSVFERLPINGKDVLVYVVNKKGDPRYIQVGRLWGDGWNLNSGRSHEEEVLFWKELPRTPDDRPITDNKGEYINI